MEDKLQRIAHIERFIDACTRLVNGKINTAEGHIAEALAAIASSRDLTELFTAVTHDFDFSAAKHRYLRSPEENNSSHGSAFLPSDRTELLAFVFCLFVEFDAGTYRLGDFLLRYFYVDGSFTASYSLFAERVVRPFRDIVRGCFPDLGKRGQIAALRARQDDVIAKIASLLTAERNRIASFNLRDEERAAADLLFAGLDGAAAKKDAGMLSALLAGYRYFLRYFGGENESSTQIFRLAAEL